MKVFDDGGNVTVEPLALTGPPTRFHPAPGFDPSYSASQNPIGAGGTAPANVNANCGSAENDTVAEVVTTTNASGFGNAERMSAMRRALWSTGVEPGCVDCRVTVAVAMPAAVAGNWPLTATPEAIAGIPNDAGAEPIANDWLACAGGAGVGVTGPGGGVVLPPPPPPPQPTKTLLITSSAAITGTRVDTIALRIERVGRSGPRQCLLRQKRHRTKT
jgi:hypothetical protein